LCKETLVEQCVAIIYNNIINVRPGFEPGSCLNIHQLASQFGVSETPLKVACKLLDSKGVLKIKPRKGTYVAELSKRDIEELLEIRIGLELMAIKLGGGYFSPECLAEMEVCLGECETDLSNDNIELYRERDAKFHRLIVMAAGNKRLNRLYADFTTSERFLNVYCPWNRKAIDNSYGEHRQLLVVFRRRDVKECLVELEEHWKNSGKRAMEGYENLRKSLGNIDSI
jgi:DNA-binding GntR family transcriptional regulator